MNLASQSVKQKNKNIPPHRQRLDDMSIYKTAPEMKDIGFWKGWPTCFPQNFCSNDLYEKNIYNFLKWKKYFW